MACIDFQRRHDIAPGAYPGVAGAGAGIAAVAIRVPGQAGVGTEARVVQIQQQVEAAHIVARVVQVQLRRLVIGRDDLVRLLQRLPFLVADKARPVILLPAQLHVAGEGALAQQRVAAVEVVEVAPVVVIADAFQVHVQLELAVAFRYRGESLRVLEDIVPAVLVVTQVVARQEVALQAAGVRVFQIAELAVQVHTPVAVQRGHDGGIAVGGDVEVVRHGNFKAVLGAQREGGRQQAGAALVRQREAQAAGNRQDRHAIEHQRAVFDIALIGFGVDDDFFATDIPGRVPVALLAVGPAAGAVDHVVADAVAAVDEFDLAGPGQAAVALQLHLHVVEAARLGIQLQLQLLALVDIAVTLDAHIAGGRDLVGGNRVVQGLALHHGAGLPDDGSAGGRDIQVDLPLDLVGLDHGRATGGLLRSRGSHDRRHDGNVIAAGAVRPDRCCQAAAQQQYAMGDRRAQPADAVALWDGRGVQSGAHGRRRAGLRPPDNS